MNRHTIYIFLCICSLAMLFGCRQRVALPDLRESYSYKDTKPFGAFVAKRILENSFPDNYIQTAKLSFAKNVAVFDDTSSVYFCASRSLFMEEKDVDALLEYVYSGNTAFFAAANFDTVLLNRIFCKVSVADMLTDISPVFYKQTSVRLSGELMNNKDSFGYFYRPFLNSFSEINDRYARIIGYNAEGKTNCIVFFWGKGKLFLHSDPRAFSNYFLLKNDNYRYMEALMQIIGLNPQHVYWDDYYNKRNYRRTEDNNRSSLSVLFKYPPLTAAFWLLLLMLLLYILFGGKRRQRVIRQIKPNLNSSVAFTETVARLYMQKHDNKNIADKMITYFYEFIRNNYFLSTNVGSKDFISVLSRKSGVPEEKTTALFHAIDHASRNSTLDDYQLLSLNEQIQQFYKKRK